jgi:hypothetical protein
MIGLNLTEHVSFRPGDANEAPWTTEAEGRLGYGYRVPLRNHLVRDSLPP